jgi:hypothetical protein
MFRHCEERSDEAIESRRCRLAIAGSLRLTLAMTFADFCEGLL